MPAATSRRPSRSSRPGGRRPGRGWRTRAPATRTSLQSSTNEDVEVVKAGGWSQRRYERRAMETWKTNAGEVAEEVGNIAKQVDARVIAVTGETDAVRLLCDALPNDMAALVRRLDDH